MAIYSPELAVAAIVHVFTAVAWMGVYFTIELVVLRDLSSAKRVQDLGSLKNHAARLSMMATVLGVLTLGTGLAYLFVKFGTDFSSLADRPEPRTVLIGLFIVLFLLFWGVVVLKPRAAALGKRVPWLDPAQPLPDDFVASAATLVKLARVQGVGLSLTLVLMVLATQGGI